MTQESARRLLYAVVDAETYEQRIVVAADLEELLLAAEAELERLREALRKRGCPDGGTCHHDCETECFRVKCCAPLSGVFVGDVWPDSPNTAKKKVTHGRHCTCRACARENWANPNLACCGMHGPSCPPVYAPLGYAGEVVASSDTAKETVTNEAVEDSS